MEMKKKILPLVPKDKHEMGTFTPLSQIWILFERRVRM